MLRQRLLSRHLLWGRTLLSNRAAGLQWGVSASWWVLHRRGVRRCTLPEEPLRAVHANQHADDYLTTANSDVDENADQHGSAAHQYLDQHADEHTDQHPDQYFDADEHANKYSHHHPDQDRGSIHRHADQYTHGYAYTDL